MDEQNNETNEIFVEALNKYRESLPDEEKGAFKEFKDISALAKSYRELQKQVSSRGLGLGENPEPEDLKKLYKKLGVPETEEGYEFKTEKIEFPEEFTKALKKQFLEANINKSQAEALVKFIENAQEKVETERESSTKTRKEQIETAKKEIFKDELDKVTNLINAAVKKVFDKDEIASQFGELIQSNPEFMQGFKKLAEVITGDNPAGFKTSADKAMQSKERYLEYKNNPELRKKIIAGDKAAVEEFRALQDLVHGSGEVKSFI